MGGLDTIKNYKVSVALIMMLSIGLAIAIPIMGSNLSQLFISMENCYPIPNFALSLATEKAFADGETIFYNVANPTNNHGFYDGVNSHVVTPNFWAKYIGIQNIANEWTGKNITKIVINSLVSYSDYSIANNATFNGALKVGIFSVSGILKYQFLPSKTANDVLSTVNGTSSNNAVGFTYHTLTFTGKYVLQDNDIIGYTFKSVVKSNGPVVTMYVNDIPVSNVRVVDGYSSVILDDTVSMPMKLYESPLSQFFNITDHRWYVVNSTTSGGNAEEIDYTNFVGGDYVNPMATYNRYHVDVNDDYKLAGQLVTADSNLTGKTIDTITVTLGRDSGRHPTGQIFIGVYNTTNFSSFVLNENITFGSIIPNSDITGGTDMNFTFTRNTPVVLKENDIVGILTNGGQSNAYSLTYSGNSFASNNGHFIGYDSNNGWDSDSGSDFNARIGYSEHEGITTVTYTAIPYNGPVPNPHYVGDTHSYYPEGSTPVNSELKNAISCGTSFGLLGIALVMGLIATILSFTYFRKEKGSAI